MNTEYIKIPVKSEVIESFELHRAKTCYNAVQNSPFCIIVWSGKITEKKDIFNPDDEILIFDTEVEIPQYPKNDISRIERLAIIFFKDDNILPYVFALRKNFPQVIHENLFFKNYPKSLCIYDKSYEELKIIWSSAVFIEDIRNWLKLTAKGILHQDDQQMEPLVLFYVGDIILPYDIGLNENLYSVVFQQKSGKILAITSRTSFNHENNISFNIIHLKGKPQFHGIINELPQNFEDLHSFLQKAGIDLKSELINSLKIHKSNNTNKLLFLITLPVRRNPISEVEKNEFHAYLTFDSIKEMGIKIGLWQVFEGKELADIFPPNIKNDNFTELKVGLLKPQFTFNRNLSNILNNFSHSEEIPNILAIGLGALGSQVFMNLARCGFGKWTLVDDDTFYPHNLARHFLEANYLYFPKVISLSNIANNMLNDNSFSFPIDTNILKQQDENDKKNLDEKIKECDIVFDFAANTAVSRYICNNSLFSNKRILSSFLNPTGNYNVILLESNDKSITIDVLEMLFYRELITNASFENYFIFTDKGEIRYSTSCKDISSRIPQDFMSIHASVTSNFIKTVYNKDEARACLMYYNNNDFNLCKYEIKIPSIFKREISDWEIVVDSVLFDKVNHIRQIKLPKETGGILVGSWDVEYKKIYILDTIIPDNNEEYPNCFYRGIEGLQEKLERISKLSAGMLKYVGEWHSHPNGCPPKLSGDDIKLLVWLTQNMSLENLPALMMILGDDQKFNLFLGETIE
jgi:integrative and conjugative element protein (TIGR02256 family)